MMAQMKHQRRRRPATILLPFALCALGCGNSDFQELVAGRAVSANIDLTDTPFGSIFTIPNWPNSNLDDFEEAFNRLHSLGSIVCYIWEWLEGDAGLVHATKMAREGRRRGFDVLLQMGPQRLGDVTPPSGLGIASFLDPVLQERYINDAVKLAQLKPKWLVLATEINLLLRTMPEEFVAFTNVYKRAYTAVKAVAPDTQVGVSYHLLAMAVDRRFDIIEQMGPQDFIGFTTYPDSLVAQGTFASVAAFPRDYYSGIRELFPDRPIAITEMGWTTFEDPEMDDQREFILRLPELLRDLDPIIVCWAMLYDADAFDIRFLTESQRNSIQARFGLDPELLFARLNRMALFSADGASKPGYYSALAVFGGR